MGVYNHASVKLSNDYSANNQGGQEWNYNTNENQPMGNFGAMPQMPSVDEVMNQQSAQNNPQPQMPQQQLPPIQQNVSLPGKVVEGVDNVKTMDIPMDGNVYYFPKADGTEIYTKRWLQNGTTEQLVFKVQQAETEPEKPNPLFEKLDGIQEQINKLEELISKQSKPTSKKEG